MSYKDPINFDYTGKTAIITGAVVTTLVLNNLLGG